MWGQGFNTKGIGRVNHFFGFHNVFHQSAFLSLRFAATIFAFGQTGSGKTFTITGPENDASITSLHNEETQSMAGIVPRSLRFLFEEMTKQSAIRKFTVKAAYLEIYNENVKDLLNPTNSSLAIRWTASRGFFVENLFVVECEVLSDCLAVLEEGVCVYFNFLRICVQLN